MTENNDDNIINYLHKQFVKYRITWHDTLEKIGVLGDNDTIIPDKIEDDNIRNLLIKMTTYIDDNNEENKISCTNVINDYINNPAKYSEIVPSTNEIRIWSSILFNRNSITDPLINKFYDSFVLPDDFKNECQKYINDKNNGDKNNSMLSSYIVSIMKKSDLSFLLNKITEDFCNLYIETYNNTQNINTTDYNVLYKICNLILIYRHKKDNEYQHL